MPTRPLYPLLQAVHPELGGFLSSLERRLEFDVRGVTTGPLFSQLPNACDVITAIRSVQWISRIATGGVLRNFRLKRFHFFLFLLSYSRTGQFNINLQPTV